MNKEEQKGGPMLGSEQRGIKEVAYTRTEQGGVDEVTLS
jgi:hypothetical protein